MNDTKTVKLDIWVDCLDDAEREKIAKNLTSFATMLQEMYRIVPGCKSFDFAVENQDD